MLGFKDPNSMHINNLQFRFQFLISIQASTYLLMPLLGNLHTFLNLISFIYPYQNNSVLHCDTFNVFRKILL